MNNPATGSDIFIGFTNTTDTTLVSEFAVVADTVTGLYETSTALKINRIEFSVENIRDTA